MGKARLLIKEEGVLAGVETVNQFLRSSIPIYISKFLSKMVRPSNREILLSRSKERCNRCYKRERLVLNIMQRMSGIATTTRKYVNLLEGTKTRVLDTRKTTPGMRMLEKQAVKIGGGENHRIGLFDMILLKDNHIDFAGGIENAVSRAQAYLKEKKQKTKNRS
jgi:nicotinate-nucleotide pyrophosphorylase (carboxylating)